MFEDLLLPYQQIYQSCSSIQFLEQLLKFLVNLTLLKYVNPIRTGGGGGGVFHQARGFLPITLEVMKVDSRNLVTFPRI